MKREYTFCQSCGMPLNKDPQGGGTNNDGTKSNQYCSFCYQDGAFKHPTTNVKEFREMCRKIMIGNGYPKFVAWLLTRNINRLERWR